MISQTQLLNTNQHDYSHQNTQQPSSLSTEQNSPRNEYLSMLTNLVHNYEEEVQLRQRQMLELKTKMKQFHDHRNKKRTLELKQSKLQSQLQDLQSFESKLQKQLKLLSQQEQITKGKAIVCYNRINESKQQQIHQSQKQPVLLKQLEELKNNTETIKSKISLAKSQNKKKQHQEHQLEETQLKQEINKLNLELQSKEHQLNKLKEKKKYMLTQEQYNHLKQQAVELQIECDKWPALQNQRKKLLHDQSALQERINFLNHLDLELLSEKQSLLNELTQKYHILQHQKEIYQTELQTQQNELSQLTQLLQLDKQNLKKTYKKKKEQKNKTQPQEQTNDQLGNNQHEEKQTNRWKGKNLKKICFLAFLLFIVSGLLLGSLNNLL